MPLSKRIFLADEELGKKDDDHHYRKPAHSRRLSLASWRLPRRRRAFTVLLGVLLCCWLLTSKQFLAVPSDNKSRHDKESKYQPFSMNRPVSRPTGPPPAVSDQTNNENKHHFNGPIRFFSLARTLYSSRGYWGFQPNNIVVFAVANLKCLSDLLPIACEMSEHKLNKVHLVLMGREEISIEGLQEVNGYNESECSVFWHDARPDYGPWSTDARMEVGVKSALVHMYNVLRPRVVITHESRDESYLTQGVKAQAKPAGFTHIGLRGRVSAFKWITSLDARALSVWHNIQIEILIQAPPSSSGSIRRLLKSLQKADYFGPAPRLTIELPWDVDPQFREYLGAFTWPPRTNDRQFILRRRITHKITAQEAAVRSIDAFYPRDPSFCHVLVLSPQTELSPSFYHFLKYSVMKYRYPASESPELAQLLGISLELPSTKLIDGDKFSPPSAPSSMEIANNTLPVFLWQAPNSNAALYFGDKWSELHSFLSNRFSPVLETKLKTHPKSILSKYPSWMAYLLELVRVRGYYMLYPSFATEGEFSLVTVHNELFHDPEEFSSTAQTDPVSSQEIIDPHQTLLEKTFNGPKPAPVENTISNDASISNLLDAFPSHLPRLSSLMRVLSPSGEIGMTSDLLNATEKRFEQFRLEVGGCDRDTEPMERLPTSSDDLFCLEGKESD